MKAVLVSLLAIFAGTAAFAGDNVGYKVDGADFEGYFAKASGPSKGLVLVIHDWDGLGGYEQKRADMLAQMGYDAFAVDLFGKGNRPATVEARMAETGKLYKDREKMRSLLLGGLSEAQKLSQGNVVVMGYCFGGTAVLELARSGKASKVKGYATFHGGLATPAGQSYAKDTPPIFVAHGGADTDHQDARRRRVRPRNWRRPASSTTSRSIPAHRMPSRCSAHRSIASMPTRNPGRRSRTF